MKTVTLAIAILLTATAVVAIAPAAEAKPYCTWQESYCNGDVCMYVYGVQKQVCMDIVYDPCWFQCWLP